jgi:hypothetical protein
MKKLVRRSKMPDEDRTQLNPQIATTEIGRRTLRELKIYPLSLGDQLATSSIIKDAFSAVASSDDDVEMAGIVMGLLEQNIPLILEYIVDTDEEVVNDLLKDITNTQAVTIAEIVFEQNYESLIKKVKGLFDRMMKKMENIPPSKRPLPESVSSTDTDSKTSTEKDSEKADSQSDK